MKRCLCILLVYLASEESKSPEGKFFLHWEPADQYKKEPLQYLHTTWVVFVFVTAVYQVMCTL